MVAELGGLRKSGAQASPRGWKRRGRVLCLCSISLGVRREVICVSCDRLAKDQEEGELK